VQSEASGLDFRKSRNLSTSKTPQGGNGGSGDSAVIRGEPDRCQ